MFRTVPVYSLDLESLRRAGRFASPEGDGGEGGKAGDPPKDGGKPGDPPKDGGKPDGEQDKGGGDVTARITTLVGERNAAQREAGEFKATAERLQQQLDQLKGSDQTQVVKDLQKRITELESSTKTRFDTLLENALVDLPEAAAKAVKAIPGGSEAQFDWLMANRAILAPAGESERKKSEDSKGINGPKNERKPKEGEDGGASTAAKSYVESHKPQKVGFPGLM